MIKKSKILIYLLACLSINTYCYATKVGPKNPDSTSSSPQQLSLINIEDLLNHEDERPPVRQIFPMINPPDIVFPDQIPLLPVSDTGHTDRYSYETQRIRAAIGNYDSRKGQSRPIFYRVCLPLAVKEGHINRWSRLVKFALMQLKKNHKIPVKRDTYRHSELMFKFFDDNPQFLPLAIQEIDQLRTRSFKFIGWSLVFTD